MAEEQNGINGVEERAPSPMTTTATAIAAPGKLSSAEILMQQHALPGKQSPQSKPAEGQSRARPLDLTSAEAFPSLGGSRKGSPTTAAPASWGAGMVIPATNGKNKGDNGSTELLPGAFTPAVPGSRGQSTIYLPPAQKRPASELKRPAGELVMEIMKNTSTRIERQQTATQTTVFIISGIEANRQRAIREIYREMSAKKSITLTIPAIVRPYIIGKGGSKVQELEKMTLTRIRVPPMQVSDGPPAEYDDEETIDIAIEGDEYGVPTAVEKINEIVAERTIFVTTRMSDIPGELYPFIKGPHGRNVEEFETKVQRVTVPDYFFTAKSSPFSPPSGPIVITGEKPAVREVRAEIEKMVEEMKSAVFQSVIFTVDRMKHRLFTANKGHLIHDILAASGCTVILPPGGGHDRLIIYGPREKIPLGKQEVQKSADAYQTLGIDVCKAYPKAPGGTKLQARDVTRHLVSKDEFKKLATELDAEITIPPKEELCDLQNNSCVIRIIAGSKDSLDTVKTRVQALYSKFSPDRLVRFGVEPLHHRLITGKNGQGVQRITSGSPGVSLLLPVDSHDSEIVLLYDGSSSVAAEIATSLEQVKERVLELVESQKFDVAEKVISVPEHLHAKIQGEGGSTLNALNPSSVLVHFGPPKTGPGHSTPAAVAAGGQDKITLRGPKGNIESTANSILAFVGSIPEDGNLPVVIEAFPYPSHLSPRLIGARGANINKLRYELGVEINLKEGQGEIKGIQVAVDAAKRKLSSQIKEFLDKAIEHLKIPQEFHSALIGSGGNAVRNLESIYGVRIMFPRAAKDKGAPDADGTDIAAKQGSNGTTTKGGKDSVEVAIKQDPNEVIIKGGKDGVAKARAEIVALLGREIEKNHTATVPVTPRAIEFMFKNAAKEIKQLRDDQNLRIDIPQRNAVVASGEKLAIKIRGTEDKVKNAKTILSRIVKEAEKTTSRTINVEKKYHRALIGTGGRILKEIVVAAGGPDDRQALARMVRFPSQDSEGDEVTVQGDIVVVEKIIQAIEKIVQEKQSQISTIIEVAPEKHWQLIGREGSIRKELEARFGVIIDIPRQRLGQVSSSEVKLTGMEENVQNAKEHILEMVKEAEGETVQVPRHLYYTVTESLRRLPREYRVSVDRAGQSRPQRAEEPKEEHNGDLPLITDDDGDASQGFAWRVIEQVRSSEDGELFPWVLRGKSEAIAKAKAEIEKIVAASGEQSNIGYLVLPDPSKFRFVVGPGGSQVDKIRRDTGCHVIVPRGQVTGEPIKIQGSKEGVEAAKDIILGLVRGGGVANGVPNGAGRGRRRY